VESTGSFEPTTSDGSTTKASGLDGRRSQRASQGFGAGIPPLLVELLLEEELLLLLELEPPLLLLLLLFGLVHGSGRGPAVQGSGRGPHPPQESRSGRVDDHFEIVDVLSTSVPSSLPADSWWTLPPTVCTPSSVSS
jgi:hypothetical protein